MKLYRFKRGQVYCRVAKTLVGWAWEAVVGLQEGKGFGKNERDALQQAEAFLQQCGVDTIKWERVN